MPRNHRQLSLSCALIAAALITACANVDANAQSPTDAPTSAHPIVVATSTRRPGTAAPSLTPTKTPIPSATPTATIPPTSTPAPYDYSAMQEEVATFIRLATARESYDLGVAFIDLSTGQTVHV